MRACARVLAGAAAIVLVQTSSSAQSAGDVFAGKTITIVVGYDAGGGYDQYARLFANHASSHIPGRSALVVRNMPGAGSLRSANFLFNVAPKDGTTIGTFGQNLPMHQATGGANVEYDSVSFNWLGNFSSEINVVTVWHTTRINSIQDVMKRELTVGATAPNSTSFLFPTIMNNILGTKFKIIVGYPGGQSIPLAMERGEVGGRGSESWSALLSLRRDWLKEGKVKVLVQIGLQRHPGIPDVPLMSDLAKTEEDKRVLELLSSSTAIGRPLVAPPSVSSSVVAVLRQAFDRTVRDPAFVAEAERAGLELESTSGEELQKIVTQIMSTPKHIIANAQKAQTSGEIIQLKK